jgi:hypothetical protein
MVRSTIRYNDGSDDYDYPFIALHGSVQLAGMVLEDITRPGQDGRAFRQVGVRAEPFEMVGIFDRGEGTSPYDANPLRLSQLRGKLVTVFDDHGTQFDDVVILEVAKVDEQRISTMVGGLMDTGVATTLESVRFSMISTADNA